MYMFSNISFMSYVSLLLFGNGSLLRYINSVKEFTQILVADVSGLLDLGTSKGNKGDVISTELNLILCVSRPNVLDTLKKLDLTDPLFSEEVANFNSVTGEGNIDGEMRVDETHLVQEPLGDTHHHVINVGAHRAHTSELLTVGEPQVNTNVLLSNLSEVHVNVLEVTGQCAAGSSDLNKSGVDLNLNCKRNRAASDDRWG